MNNFNISLEYDKQVLVNAMKRCHKINNVLIERNEDLSGIVQFLLDASGCSGLTLSDDYTASRIEGQNVAFSLQGEVGKPDWRNEIEEQLHRFQNYLENCTS